MIQILFQNTKIKENHLHLIINGQFNITLNIVIFCSIVILGRNCTWCATVYICNIVMRCQSSPRNLPFENVYSHYYSRFVESNAFRGLKILVEIDASQNPIDKLPTNLFEGNNELRVIKFANNSLTDLQVNF